MKNVMLIFSVLLTGCAGIGSTQISVDAIAAEDAQAYRSYYLVPGVGANPGLVYDQYATQLEEMLSTVGMERVGSIDNADAVVLLGYRVGNAQTENYTRAVPQWGQTGYSSSRTTSTVSGNNINSNTQYTPRYGITGYSQVSESITSFPLVVSMLAATSPKHGTPREIWSVTVGASSSAPDLRRAFPYMMRAAAPYVARDSGGITKVRIRHDEIERTPR